MNQPEPHAESSGILAKSSSEILASIPRPNDPRPTSEVLGEVAVERAIVQDFRPLDDCLEWKLSGQYWRTEGVRPFIEGAVPYVIHNNGWAAQCAAEVFLANQNENDEGRLEILELGAGLGLFARQFLDHLQKLCEEKKSSVYARLRYFITDFSPRTLDDWAEREVFTDHDEHLVIGHCDALKPFEVETPSGETHSLAGVAAVFANYLLDSLPTAVVREDKDGPQQLCVRTYLVGELPLPIARDHGLDAEEIAQLAANPQDESLTRLLPILPYFDFELAFQPVAPNSIPYMNDLFSFAPGSKRSNLNYGALRCITECQKILADTGFLLINDYGPVNADQVGDLSYASRFGRSVAASLNFPFLESQLVAKGFEVVSPPDPDARSVHTRLLGRGLKPATRDEFLERFGGLDAFDADRLATEGNQHIHAGRYADALDCFRDAVERCPSDWNLLGQTAQFLTQQLQRSEEALELIQRALEINPWYSPFLWNTLGNCLFLAGEADDAHRAYLRALALDARDAQTHLNLAYSFLERGDHSEALTSIARGLEFDADGRFDEALLNKQRQIVGALDAERAAQRERDNQRHEVFSHAW